MISFPKSTRSNSHCPAGQASLEYLLVTAAFLSVLLLLAPYFNYLWELSLFTSNVGKARYFMEQATHEVSLLYWLGEGSQTVVSVHPDLEWEAEFSGRTIRITVHSQALQQHKTLERTTALPLTPATFSLSSEQKFIFRKERGMVSVIYP